MENARQFYVNIYAYVANRVVNLEVLRGDRQLSTSVAVRVRSDNPERVAGMFDKEQRLVARLGILAVVVDEEVSRLLPVLRRPGGIFVTRLAASARAPTGLFLPGDIIYSVNGKYVETLDELSMIIDEYESGDVVVLQIERGGRLSFIEVELD
jgi:S1-C subfamily serine protease